jgi:hypothetical protein
MMSGNDIFTGYMNFLHSMPRPRLVCLAYLGITGCFQVPWVQKMTPEFFSSAGTLAEVQHQIPNYLW